MSATTLLTFGSWEPRFVLGAKDLYNGGAISRVIVPFAEEYAGRTQQSRNDLRKFVEDSGGVYSEFSITLARSINCWRTLSQEIPRIIGSDRDVLLDISTAPREAIWYILHILNALNCNITWRYYRPAPDSYARDWLSRNAQSPRLLLKRSGVALPGQKTCIVALAGFDTERLAQLIEKFEPGRCLVGRQTGKQFGNESRNTGFDTAFVHQRQITIFDFDCYDTSAGAIDKLLAKIPSDTWRDFNVIGTSLGPKPSAITMFMLSQIHPEMGLVYVPSGDYNPNYSDGIDLSTVSEGYIRATSLKPEDSNDF